MSRSPEDGTPRDPGVTASAPGEGQSKATEPVKGKPKRIGKIVLATLGAVLLAFVTGFGTGAATPVGNSIAAWAQSALPVGTPSPVATNPSCPDDPDLKGRVGEQSLQVRVRATESECWTSTLSSFKPGSTIQVLLVYANRSRHVASNVTIVAWIPPIMHLVSGRTELANTVYPKGKSVSDDIASAGINFGNYASGSVAYARFYVLVPDTGLDCGLNSWVIAARGTGGELPRDWTSAGLMTSANC